MTEDRYRKGAPLGRDGLFQLVTDEAFRDGRIDAVELDLLNRLARFLKLDAVQARAIARLSKGKFRSGLLGPARPLSPGELYGETLAFVMSDGRIDPLEEAMITGLRKLFRIGDDEDRAARAAAAERVAGWRIADSEGQVPGEVVASKSRCFHMPCAVDEARVQAWLEAWMAGDRSVLAGARDFLAGLVEDFARGERNADMTVSLLFDLGPILVDGGEVTAWQAALRALGEADVWNRRPALLDCLARRSMALVARRPDDASALAMLDFHRDLAEGSVEGKGWRAWAGALRVLLRERAKAGDWPAHERLLAAFEAAPSERRDLVAEDLARAVSEGMDAARDGGDWPRVWTLFDRWTALAVHLDDPAVRREEAAALDGLLEGIEGDRDGEILEFEKAYCALRELREAYPDDPSVARAFASASASAMRTFLALQEDESLSGLLDQLGDVIRRHGEAEGVAANLAVGLLEVLGQRLPRQRARDEEELSQVDVDSDALAIVLPPEDFALVAARRLLDELLRRCPRVAEVESLRERLEALEGGRAS